MNVDARSKVVIAGLVVAFIFVGVGVVALGFANETLDVIASLLGAPEWEVWFPPLLDYEIPGLEGNIVASFLLGTGFTALVLALTFGIMWLVVRRQKPRT
jgi:hypothetical protein